MKKEIFLAIYRKRQYNSKCAKCRCSSSVEHQLPKLGRRVRFPSSASDFPREDCEDSSFGDFLVFGRKWKLRKSLSFPWLNITKHQI